MKEEMRVHLLHNHNHNSNKSNKLLQVLVVDEKTIVDNNNNNININININNNSTITPTLLFSTFIAVLGSISMGLAIGYTSPVQSEIINELGLSTSQYSVFASINNFGTAVGALVCGKLADYLGRRRALGLADIFYVLGWVSIAISQEAWMLDVGRFMLGISTSICGFVVPVYISEFTPTNLRGGFVVLYALTYTMGGSLVYLLGLIIPWRTLALICSIPSIVQIIGVLFIPESPRWLMMIGKYDEFEAALQQFRGATVDISQEVFDIKVCAEALQEKSDVSLLQAFQKKYAYTWTVGIGLAAFPMLVGVNGMVAYSCSIFESAGLSEITGMIALSVTQLLSVAFSVFLTDKYGRRPLLMISSVGLCLGCVVTAVAFTLQDYRLSDGFSSYIALIGILVYTAAYPIGVGGVSFVIVPEIFPLNIKGISGSVTGLTSALSGWLISYAFNFSMDWSSSGTFFVLAGVCVTTLVFVAKLVPETKGKTLEEIHLEMKGVWQ